MIYLSTERLIFTIYMYVVISLAIFTFNDQLYYNEHNLLSILTRNNEFANPSDICFTLDNRIICLLSKQSTPMMLVLRNVDMHVICKCSIS